jgi:hypothetical protein
MQKQQEENRQAWKFILEKIPVLPRHERIAEQLTAGIIARKNQGITSCIHIYNHLKSYVTLIMYVIA